MAKAAVQRNAEPLVDFDQCVEDGDDYEISSSFDSIRSAFDPLRTLATMAGETVPRFTQERLSSESQEQRGARKACGTRESKP